MSVFFIVFGGAVVVLVSFGVCCFLKNVSVAPLIYLFHVS